MSEVLDTLKLVAGATSEKDIIPVLKHFAFRGERVYATDGRITISAPCIELASIITGTVDAQKLIAAFEIIGTGKWEIIKPLDDMTHIKIKANNFLARIPMGPIDAFPFTDEGAYQLKKIALLDVLRKLKPFIGTDASRPWSCGVYLGGAVAAATNNVTLAVCPSPLFLSHEIMLPVFAVDELIRIGEEPIGILQEDNRISFLLPYNATLSSVLVTEQWPKLPMELLKAIASDAQYRVIPKALAQAVEYLLPFCLDPKAPLICFTERNVHTQEGEIQGRVDNVFSHQGRIALPCRFRAEPLRSMLDVATHADFTKFPRVPWKGVGIEGAIVGVVT